MVLPHATCESASPPPWAAPLALRSTVHLQHGVGHITQTVVGAVAVRCAGTLPGNRLDEGILLLGPPPPNRLVQALGPPTGHDAQPADLRRRPREPGLSTPYPLPPELAHHIQRFMALFRWQSVDRQHQRRDIPVGLSELCRGWRSCRSHGLVQATLVLDDIVGQPERVRVLSCCTKLGDRPRAGNAALAEPTNHLPAQPPARHTDGQCGCGAERAPPTLA
jgi:hypothetical protein